MENLKLDAYAKINLSLDVLRKREDGYHDLSMIMQQIDVKDVIELSALERDEIAVESDCKSIPLNKDNIVYKVAYTIKERYNVKKGIKIKIEKHIPLAAGLAGGSADAAATLKGLNEMWSLGLSDETLMEIGKPIGADIPYCILGGTALAEGIGEKLTKLESFKDKHILLANPNIEVSTAEVYRNLRLSDSLKRPDTEKLIEAIKASDEDCVAKHMANVLETVTIPMHREIEDIKRAMVESGALGAMMSGSGPTVFGIYKSEKELEEAKTKLEKIVKTVIKTKTI